MSDSKSQEDIEITLKTKLAFSCGEIGDGVAYQTFSFLIFTFYFCVVGLPVLLITLGFILWSIWNAINDPLVGYLSDRTSHRLGRRIPWMMASVIPLSVLMVLLFTPQIVPDTDLTNFMYFMLILILFDTCYSAFNLNYNSMFSEMFTSMEDRASVGNIRGIFVIVALLMAFILPTIIIEDLTNQYGYSKTPNEYILMGVIAGCTILVTLIITLKWGVRNPKEFAKDHETSKSFKDSFSLTFKNKAFLLFLLPALSTWMCIGLLPTVIPLFATYVLKITDENSILTGVLLMAHFLAAAVSLFLWAKIRKAKGVRITGLIAIAIWAATLFLFMFTWDFISAVVVLTIGGIGLGGCLYFYDQTLAEIIDEDELLHGTRRAGTYYGMINLMIRLSVIINFVVIGILFSSADWQTYTPNPGTDIILVLRFLVGGFPLIILTIGFIGLYFYPIHGNRLEENRKKIDDLHAKKRAN